MNANETMTQTEQNFSDAFHAARQLKRRALLIARNAMNAAVREYANLTGLDRRTAYVLLIRAAAKD